MNTKRDNLRMYQRYINDNLKDTIKYSDFEFMSIFNSIFEIIVDSKIGIWKTGTKG